MVEMVESDGRQCLSSVWSLRVLSVRSGVCKIA